MKDRKICARQRYEKEAIKSIMRYRRMNNAPSHEKARSLAKRLEFGPAPFIVGLVVALVFGWWIFLNLFSRQDQPVQFSHETHLKDASLDCSVCHHLRAADGTFWTPCLYKGLCCLPFADARHEAERSSSTNTSRRARKWTGKSTRSSLTTCSSAMPCTRWQEPL